MFPSYRNSALVHTAITHLTIIFELKAAVLFGYINNIVKLFTQITRMHLFDYAFNMYIISNADLNMLFMFLVDA